jgi:hypothetical protein
MRKTGFRKTNAVFLLVCEGHNKTEKTYFPHYNRRYSGFSIKVVEGGETDIPGLYRLARQKCRENHLKISSSDHVYILVDSDGSKKRLHEIDQYADKDPLITFVVSIPIFEGWFLLHYEDYSPNLSGAEVLRRLKKYHPDYKKSDDLFDRLLDKREEAFHRAEEFAKKDGCDKYLDAASLVKKIK